MQRRSSVAVTEATYAVAKRKPEKFRIARIQTLSPNCDIDTNQTNCKLVIKLGASPSKIMLLSDLFLIPFSSYYCFPISPTLQAGSMKQVLSAYNLFTTIYLVHSQRF